MSQKPIHELTEQDVKGMALTEAMSLDDEKQHHEMQLAKVNMWKSNRLALLTARYFILTRVNDAWEVYGASGVYEVHDKPFDIKLLEAKVADQSDVIVVELNYDGMKHIFRMKAQNGQEFDIDVTPYAGAPTVLIHLQVFTNREEALAELEESRPFVPEHPAATRPNDGDDSDSTLVRPPAATAAGTPTLPAPASDPPSNPSTADSQRSSLVASAAPPPPPPPMPTSST